MIKGTRTVLVRDVQTVSIHGQLSLDLAFVDAAAPEGDVEVARVGPESAPAALAPGDRVELDYLFGVVTAVRRAE